MIVSNLPKWSENEKPFDYIVIGSGAGGAPLAARLAEQGHRVLVMEAGQGTQSMAGNLKPANEITDVPALHAQCAEDPLFALPYWVKHYETPRHKDSKSDADGRVLYPRAAGIGGCTLHNSMITVVGPAKDWDELAWRLNDPSWGADVMRGYFQRVERCEYLKKPVRPRGPWRRLVNTLAWLLGKDEDPTAGRHGFDGWLHTTLTDFDVAKGDDQYMAMLAAAARTSWWRGLDSPLLFVKQALAGEATEALDINHFRRQSERPEGFVRVPASIHHTHTDGQRHGVRSGAAQRLLDAEKAYSGNLIIATDVLATKIVLKPSPSHKILFAMGVEYMHGNGIQQRLSNDTQPATPGTADDRHVVHRVDATREVIVCAGAFQTPQLLMLSGIGPREELEDPSIGIKCIVHSPGVGRNLQDRYEVSVISKMKNRFSLLNGATFANPSSGAGGNADGKLTEWRQDKNGLYSTNGVVVAILKRSREELADPDLFIFGVPLKFKGYYPGYSVMKPAEFDLFSWVILKSHSSNHGGTLKLRSGNPLQVPSINFNYFGTADSPDAADDDPDLQAVVHGVEFVREIAARSGGRVEEELVPGASVVNTPRQIRQWIEQEAWGHHACGTCRMGRFTDAMAVTDSRFNVLGPVNPANPHAKRDRLVGLRVVDASIFPNIPGYFIVSNIYVASEKAADVIGNDATEVFKKRRKYGGTHP